MLSINNYVLTELMAVNPIELLKNVVNPIELDKEILRTAIIAELDAISLYEQLAVKTFNIKVKKVLLDIAREEKTHIGEFQALLMKCDLEQKEGLFKGAEEVSKF
jgi:rubrerythrin